MPRYATLHLWQVHLWCDAHGSLLPHSAVLQGGLHLLEADFTCKLHLLALIAASTVLLRNTPVSLHAAADAVTDATSCCWCPMMEVAVECRCSNAHPAGSEAHVTSGKE